jgi:predicted transcriptional regulator of viral defense system
MNRIFDVTQARRGLGTHSFRGNTPLSDKLADILNAEAHRGFTVQEVADMAGVEYKQAYSTLRSLNKKQFRILHPTRGLYQSRIAA